MSNTITIELCQEDRARLDRLAEALERKSCDKCTLAAMQYMQTVLSLAKEKPDLVSQNLAESISKAQEYAKNAPEAAEAPAPTTAPPKEEKPTAGESAEPTAEKTVGRADLRNMAIKLSASDKKERMKEIIRQYATKVSDVPEDKIAECYDKLVALEG